MKLIFKLLNLCNIDFEIHHLKILQSENYLLIGIEVTYPELQQFLHFNIDPQHDTVSQNISAIEKIYELKNELIELKKNFEKICLVTIKPDSDSIGSFALLDLLFNDVELTETVSFNIKQIGSYDHHGRENWRENIRPIFSLPPALLTMIADPNLNISEKVNNCKNFLQTNKFNTFNHYSDIAYKKNKIANRKTDIEIIIYKKLAYVESSYRGAISKGYKFCPIVVAKNPNFNFGLNNSKFMGTKFTIAQYNNSYINLVLILNDILKIEPGWGGSDIIIGSPQNKSSILTKIDILNIVKKYV